MRIGSLFSGYGGLDMAVESVFPGAVPAWFCEWDDAPSKVLAHHWPDVPNLRDVTQVDWTQVEPVDILTGGYPCQPFSASGQRKGTEDERHLWPYVREAVRVLRPRYVVLENVAGHRSLGFDRVLGDMAEDGMHVWWTSVRASDIGAPHHRERLFILATPADSEGAGHSRAGERSGRGSSVGHEAVGGSRDRRCEVDAPNPGREHGEQGREVEGSLGVGERSGQPERSSATAPDAPHHGLTWSREARDGRAGSADGGHGNVDWGKYRPAVQRWARLTRPAPAPTEPNTKGKPRLNAAFAEWMMGLPHGHVTGVGIPRTAQLKAIGNGVCPQQAAAALEQLLAIEAVTA